MTQQQVAAYAEVKILWARMCRADGIDPKAAFVTFSAKNPYTAEYNAAMNRYQNLMNDFRNIPAKGPVQNPKAVR